MYMRAGCCSLFQEKVTFASRCGSLRTETRHSTRGTWPAGVLSPSSPRQPPGGRAFSRRNASLNLCLEKQGVEKGSYRNTGFQHDCAARCIIVQHKLSDRYKLTRVHRWGKKNALPINSIITECVPSYIKTYY